MSSAPVPWLSSNRIFQWCSRPMRASCRMAETAAQTISSPAWSYSACPEARTAAKRPRSSRTKETSSMPLGQRDFVDPDLRKRLAMSVEFADALFRLIAEDEDLFVFGLT